MKPWDGLDIAGATPIELSAKERARLDSIRRALAPRRRSRAHLGSIVGLGLSVAFLGGLIWALWPVSPVAAEVRKARPGADQRFTLR